MCVCVCMCVCCAVALQCRGAVTAARLKAQGGDVLLGLGGQYVTVLRATRLQKRDRDIVHLSVAAHRMCDHVRPVCALRPFTD